MSVRHIHESPSGTHIGDADSEGWCDYCRPLPSTINWMRSHVARMRVVALLEFMVLGVLAWFAGAYVERGKVVRMQASELNRASRALVDSTLAELRTLIPLNCDTDRPMRGCPNRADSVIRRTDPR